MVSIFFYCSSPYVGYTLKQADYINKEMKSVSEKDMTTIGYKLFNSSGSFMVLGKFEGRKYFHTRQSQSENFDEQKRRIYTNVAFIGENIEDEKTINKIAMYVLFNEEAFYKNIAGMISLLDEGFTIDFNKLNLFIDKFINRNIVLVSKNDDAIRFYDKVMNCSDKEISFVITESTMSYFVKQAGYDFHNSVLFEFSLQGAENLTDGGEIKFDNESDLINPPQIPMKKEADKKVASKNKAIADVIMENKTDDKALLQKDAEIKKLKQNIHELCAERNGLELDVSRLKKKVSDLMKENTTLKDERNILNIKGILKGVIGTVLAVLVILILKWIF